MSKALKIKDKTQFIIECIEQGFTVSKLRDGKISVKKKTETGVHLRFELSKNPVDFLDGKPKDFVVSVFENGWQVCPPFKLREFEIHD